MTDLRLPPIDAELEVPRPGARRAWVRVVAGELVVTVQTADRAGRWTPGRTRPMTLLERAAWRLAGKVPTRP